MNKIFFLFLALLALTPLAYADSPAPEWAYFSEDGSHWARVLSSGSTATLTIDWVIKATYVSIDEPTALANSFYTISTDANGVRYILKDGAIVDKWEFGGLITSYTSSSKIEWWYVIDGGVYRLKDTTGKIILESANAGSSTYNSYLQWGMIVSTLYNKSNESYTTYVNDKKIAKNAYSIGTYKKGKKTEILFNATDDFWKSRIIAFDIDTWMMRSLPSYDGVWSYATIMWKSGNILELQYTVLIGEKYAIADINGKILSRLRYDEMPQITNYGNKFFKSYIKDGKTYFYFDGNVYWGYSIIDSFNVSYTSSYSYVSKWSIFVTKNGKEMIVVNGKEFPL